MEDYLASKKKANFKKEARKADELKKQNIEHNTEKKEKQSTLNSVLKNQETYSSAIA